MAVVVAEAVITIFFHINIIIELIVVIMNILYVLWHIIYILYTSIDISIITVKRGD